MGRHRRTSRRHSKKSTSSRSLDAFFVEYKKMSAYVLKTAESLAAENKISSENLAHIRENDRQLQTTRPKTALRYFTDEIREYYIAIADNLKDVVFSKRGPFWGAMRLNDIMHAGNDEQVLEIWKLLNRVTFYAFSATYPDGKDCLETALSRFFIGNSFQKTFVQRTNAFKDSLVQIDEKLDTLIPILSGTFENYAKDLLDRDWSNSRQITKNFMIAGLSIVTRAIPGIRDFRDYPQAIEDLFDIVVIEDHPPEAGEDSKLARRIIDALPYEFRQPIKQLVRLIRDINENRPIRWEPECQAHIESLGLEKLFSAVDAEYRDPTRENFCAVVHCFMELGTMSKFFDSFPDAEACDFVANTIYDYIISLREDPSGDTDIVSKIKEVIERLEPFLNASSYADLRDVSKFFGAQSDDDPEKPIPASKFLDDEDFAELEGLTGASGSIPVAKIKDELSEFVKSADGTESVETLLANGSEALRRVDPGLYAYARDVMDRLMVKLVSSKKIYRFVIGATKKSEAPSETSKFSDMSIDVLKDIDDLELNVWETVADTVARYQD